MKWLLAVLLLLSAQAHAAIVYVGTSAPVNATGTASITPPAGTVGDLIICSAAMFNPALTLPVPSSAAYTELASGSTYQFHKVWGRIATGSDTFLLASLTGYTTAWCDRYSGTSNDLSSIVDTVAVARVTQATLNFPAITPGSANDLLYYSARIKAPGAGASVATPTSFTERVDNYYSAPNMLVSSGGWIQTTLTASAQQNLTILPGTAPAGNNTAIVLAISAASGGGGGGGASWSLVGYGPIAGASGGPVTPALPIGHFPGDWLCWMGKEATGTNTLDQPAGYTQIVASQVSGHDVMAIDCKIDSGVETAPTTTLVGVGATQMVAFRGGPATISGVNATGSATSTCTTNPPSPALSITNFGALVMSFSSLNGLYGSYNASTVAPAGFATGAANVSVGSFSGASDVSLLFAYYIYPLNTTLAADTFTVTNATSRACRGVAAAIVATGTPPSITNVNTTNTFSATAVGVVINGLNFGAVQGTGSVKITDGASSVTQTVTAWGNTSITFNAVLGDDRYGARSIKVTTNGGTTFAVKDVIVSAPTGKCYFDLGTLLQPFSVDRYGAPNRFGDASNDIDDNAQLEFSNLTFSGASTCANISVDENGSYKVPDDLTSLDWIWNSGSGWISTASSRTGQNKVHIKEAGGFRISCSGTPGNTTSAPVRTTATKSICLTGCDYPNTTAGITACMSAIGNGQSCEMRSQYSDGTNDVWPARIAITSVNGTEANPKTLRVADGDFITLSTPTTSGVALLSIANSSHILIQGNSTGNTGLSIGDSTLWAYTCAQSSSSATFSGIANCYVNDKNTLITSSSDIGLMNMTMRGAAADIASSIDTASSYVYIRQSLVDLHGSNDNKAPVGRSSSGYLFDINADHVLVEDTVFSHGGAANLRVTGSFDVLRRITGDQHWSDVTGNLTYPGSVALLINTSECNSPAFGCAPYGPTLIEDSEFRGSGVVPEHPTYNIAVRLHGIGTIFRKNYIYDNSSTYLMTLCGSGDSATTAYREGEESIYNNTTWGGPPFWTDSAGYPAGISASICQKMLMANNLFEGVRPGARGGGDIYAMTVRFFGIPNGTFITRWRDDTVYSNIFGVDPANPSSNMQVALTGQTEVNPTVNLLTENSAWPFNFYNNRNVTVKWSNGTQTPSQSRAGLVMSNTSAIGVGDAAALTTTTAAGSATTTLPVATARPFKDAWGFNGHTWGTFHIEYGDCIAVGPHANSTILDAVAVRIADSGVNYTTNSITLANAITFDSGSPVWKATDNKDGTCSAIWQNKGAAQ